MNIDKLIDYLLLSGLIMGNCLLFLIVIYFIKQL